MKRLLEKKILEKVKMFRLFGLFGSRTAHHHEYEDEIKARRQLELLEFEIVISPNRISFIKQYVVPAIIDYKRKYGNDRFVKEYIEKDGDLKNICLNLSESQPYHSQSPTISALI